MKDNEYLNGYKLLVKYKFSYEEVVMIMDTCAFSRVENNSLGIILDNGCQYLLNRGYSLNEIRKMVLLCPRCLIVSDSKRKVIEDTFFELGMTFDEFKIMSIRCGNIYSYSKERIDEYVMFFRNLGYSDNEIIKVFKYALFLLRSSVSKFKKLCDDMKMFGFTDEDIYIIAKGNPSFWTHNFSKIERTINIFSSLGFGLSQIKLILRRSPSLLGYGESTIVDKFNRLIDLGFSREELVDMVVVYPTLINADIERTKEIVDFFKNLGLYERLIKEPRNFFMQGIETSYAKYCFYIDNGKDVSSDSYIKLFYGWKKFEKTYGVGRDELLEKYPYNKEKFSKSKKK